MQDKPLNEEENEIKEEPIDYQNDFTFTPGRHVWRQAGPYLICKECALHHAIYIGMDRLMVGESEDGKPILKDKNEL